MRLAVIGDIHGNIYALKSVLEHIKNKNVDSIISTGDLVGYMPYPNEVVDMIRANHIFTLQGNHDQAIGDSIKISTDKIRAMSDRDIQKDASSAFTNWCIRDDNRWFLKNLCTRMISDSYDKRIMVVHGSPFRNDEYLYDEEKLLSYVSEKVSVDIIISGHTHIPYFKEVNGKYFINAGSVGKPKHGDSRSTYVIVQIEKGKVGCSIEKVEYDMNALLMDIRNNRMISDSLIDLLRMGR